MNIAMLVATSASWNDGVVVGPAAVGGWSNAEAAAALAERYIENIAAGEEAGDPFVAERAGWTCVCARGTAEIRLAAASDVDAPAMARVLAGRFSRLRRWMYDLHRAARHETAANMLAVASSLTACSLILFDEAFNLTAYSLVEGDLSPAMQETIRRGYASAVPSEHQAQYRRLSLDHPEGFATLYPEEGGLTSVWSQPVPVGAQTLRLHAMGVNGDDIGTIALVKAAAGELQIALERAGLGNGATTVVDFVSELVERSHTPKDAQARARFFGWSEARSWVALQVEGVGEAFPFARWHHIAAVFKGVMPESHASHPGAEGITLVAPSEAVSQERLRAVCAREKVAVGWGDPVPLEKLSSSYAQACRACQTAKRSSNCPARSFDSCRADLAAQAVSALFREEELEPFALRAMRAYDAAHGSEHVKTLRAWFECDLSKAETCRALHIHRTTLDYRLARLQDMFGLALDDRPTRSLLRLAFMAEQGTCDQEPGLMR